MSTLKKIRFSYFRLEANISFSCAIPDPGGDEFIITGGFKETDPETKGSTAEVSVYNENGWKENLMSLNQGRWGHGCTSFIQKGKMVCK